MRKQRVPYNGRASTSSRIGWDKPATDWVRIPAFH